MNWADWAILAILGVSILIGVVRGFIRECLSLVIWVAAFIVAMLFHTRLAVYFAGFIDAASLRALAAWGTLFVGVLMAGSLVSFLLGQLVRSTGLTGTDRLLGTVFGAFRGFVVVMALLILLPAALPVVEDAWWRESALIPHFLACEEWVRDVAAEVAAFFQSLF